MDRCLPTEMAEAKSLWIDISEKQSYLYTKKEKAQEINCHTIALKEW